MVTLGHGEAAVRFIWMVSRGQRGKHEGERGGLSIEAEKEKWAGGTTGWGKARGVLGEWHTRLDARLMHAAGDQGERRSSQRPQQHVAWSSGSRRPTRHVRGVWTGAAVG
jgi:hypothetical protein